MDVEMGSHELQDPTDKDSRANEVEHAQARARAPHEESDRLSINEVALGNK